MLRYASSTLDFSVGQGLYMMPSDMRLKALNQVAEGYNDKLVVNNKGFALGKQFPVVKKQKPKIHQAMTKRPPTKRVHNLDDHEDEKTAIIMSIGGLTLLAMWWWVK